MKQLNFEYACAQRLEGAVWHTLAYDDEPPTKPFMRQIPKLFRALFMRQLYGWILALRLRSQYDIIMMRHMTFDPWVFLFGRLIPNRVSVHHAKEIEELRLVRAGWSGWAASSLERITGRVSAKRAIALLGVTREIAEYERDLHAPDKIIGVYPNGIDPAQVQLLDDHRIAGGVEAAFICSTFSKWHGLDRLISAVDAYGDRVTRSPLIIHLIGGLSEHWKREIESTSVRRRIFKYHGLLDASEYRPLLARCDVGIASLAMDRQNLREGSTLKVREMLAMGLAIYSAHEDVALDPGEDFVKVSAIVNVSDIVALGLEAKHIERRAIREKSLARIDKQEALKVCVEFLRQVHAATSAAVRL